MRNSENQNWKLKIWFTTTYVSLLVCIFSSWNKLFIDIIYDATRIEMHYVVWVSSLFLSLYFLVFTTYVKARLKTITHNLPNNYSFTQVCFIVRLRTRVSSCLSFFSLNFIRHPQREEDRSSGIRSFVRRDSKEDSSERDNHFMTKRIMLSITSI